MDAKLVVSSDNQGHGMQRESSNALPESTMLNETLYHFLQPECCKRHKDESGGIVDGGGYTSCMYHSLVECSAGMELSVDCRTEGICTLALHKSSGYFFSLLWRSKAMGEEAEILYRIISLHTFEWMREVVVFSTRTCPIFSRY